MNVARDLLRQESHAERPQWDFIDQLRELLVQRRPQKYPSTLR